MYHLVKAKEAKMRREKAQSFDWKAKHIDESGGIVKHVDRLKNHTNGNPKIDASKTHLNVEFVENSWLAKLAKIRKLSRAKKITGGLQSRSKPFTCFVVQSGHKDFHLDDEEANAFFEESIEFIKREFGEENVCQAVAHFDETTPHLHVTVSNLIEDPDKPGKFFCSSGAIRKIKDLETHKEKRQAGKDLELKFWDEVASGYGFPEPNHELGTKGTQSNKEFAAENRAIASEKKAKASRVEANAEIAKVYSDMQGSLDWQARKIAKLEKDLAIAKGEYIPDEEEKERGRGR